jgi:hypothetical protein|tara:strand:- start:746 stop:961 length:216 start_codon:yes stop_codon:yes gene_type:complete
MKRFDYYGVKWNDFIMAEIGKSIAAARKYETTQQLYVHRQEDAEVIMDMLAILSSMSRYAYLVEVRYVRLN